MSINMTLKLTAKPGRVNLLNDWIDKTFPETRSFDGCEQLNLFRVVDKMDTLMIIERWRSQEDYEKYFNWRKENGTLYELFDLLAVPIEMTKLELLPA